MCLPFTKQITCAVGSAVVPEVAVKGGKSSSYSCGHSAVRSRMASTQFVQQRLVYHLFKLRISAEMGLIHFLWWWMVKAIISLAVFCCVMAGQSCYVFLPWRMDFACSFPWRIILVLCNWPWAMRETAIKRKQRLRLWVKSFNAAVG